MSRIIRASSNAGDVVLDPFCGCGTAVAVAQKLGRRWVGIDVTHLAIGLIKHRLRDSFGVEAGREYEVVGEPADAAGAAALAKEDPFQFQAWALGLVGARVAASAKKGADKGVDGRLFFDDALGAGGAVKQVVFSVKAGHVTAAQVRDLRGVLEREHGWGVEIGALLALAEPTGPMCSEAASAGFYESPGGTRHPRLQLLTVGGLLAGTQRLDMPAWHAAATFRKAPKAKRGGKAARLFGGGGE